jgi:hypothetical protein
MYAVTYKFLLPFILLCLMANGVNSQSALGGLGGGLGAVNSQQTITTKVEETTPPLNIDSASMNDFLVLDKKCKSGDGNACLYAGKIMMLDKPPQALFNLSISIRTDRAIRLYESAIAANNNLEAMELAYDLYYDKNIISRELNSYTDKDKAKELMYQMLAKNYPGGLIRQARDYIEDPEYILSIGKKKEACATARNIAARQGISFSTKTIAGDLLNGNICIIFNK